MRAKLPADARDFFFALGERLLAGVDRVVTQYQRMGMLDCAAKDERRLALRAHFDGILAFCKYGELPGADFLGSQQASPIYRQPRDVVTGRRDVAPALPVLRDERESS